MSLRVSLFWCVSLLAGVAIGCGLDSHGGTSGVGGVSGVGGAGGSGGVSGVGGTGGSGGVSGVGGTGGSGGVSGVGGTGGVGGAGGTGGVGGVGGTGGTGGAMVECPALAPTQDSPCEGQGQCVISASGLPGCSTIWECFESRWVLVFDGGCVGPSLDLCWPSAEAAAGQECIGQACVYPDGSVCECEQPCSGVAPDPTLLRTACHSAPRAVCVVPRQVGDACPSVGEVCAPQCCGRGWSCEATGWQDFEVLCPP